MRQLERAGLADPAQLIATELVTNSVLHARTDVELNLSKRRRYLHVAVRDLSPALSHLGRPAEGHGGRGLQIVEALSLAWGCTETSNGKVVWATLPSREERYCGGNRDQPSAR